MLLRRSAVAVDLFGLASSAALLAAITSNLLDAALTAPPRVDEPPDPTPSLMAHLRPDATARALGLPAEPPPPLPASGRRSLPPPLRLLGTVVATRTDLSVAAIEDTRTHATRICREGDALDALRVVSIDRLRVVLDGPDGSAELGLSPPPEALTPLAPPASIEGVRVLGPNRFEVQRSAIEQAMTRLDRLARDAFVVPAFRDGVATGFRLQSVRPGGAVAALGFQAGDVLERVNGLSLDAPDRAFEAAMKLRDARTISVELRRGGAPLTLQYDVR